METKFKITGKWSEMKAKLQKKYPKLTDEDLKFSKGHEDELVDCIVDRLDKSEDEVIEIIEKLQIESGSPKSGSSNGKKKVTESLIRKK